MKYTQFTDSQVEEALRVIGVKSLDALFATIPPELRLPKELDLPRGLSELELLLQFERHTPTRAGSSLRDRFRAPVGPPRPPLDAAHATLSGD